MLWDQVKSGRFTTKNFAARAVMIYEQSLIALFAGCHALVHRCSD